MFKNDNLIPSGTKKHGLHVLNGYCYIPFACIAKSDRTNLWHLKLCHMNQKGLQVLSNQGYLGPVSADSLDFCEPCTLGKQHRLSFPKGTHLAKACLEYLHADLWGPSQVPSHGGNRYFLSIIDDFSRKVWVFLMKSKDQTLGKFISWKTLVENQTERKIKTLRTDNGLEFCNREFH